jgi:hypothetical protein
MLLDIAQFFLLALFVLTVLHLVTLKFCANVLEHHTAPLFIGGWTLIGLAAAWPVFGHLLGEAWPALAARPWLVALMIVKGGILYLLLVGSQDLMKVSLSSRHYVTPLAVGLMAIVNSFLGESLTVYEWAAALGLCALASAFLLFGHAAELGSAARRVYARLVLMVVATAAIDQAVLVHINWFTLLLVSNGVLLGLGLLLHARNLPLLKTAALHPLAITAGVVYAATELLKFYQMVDINKVTSIVVVQAMTKPVILILSALIWKERTVKEQLVWGVMAFIVALPMFVDFSGAE